MAAAAASALKENRDISGGTKTELGRGRVAHVGTRDCGVGGTSVATVLGGRGPALALNRSLISHPPSAPPAGAVSQDRHAKTEIAKARRVGEGREINEQQRGGEGSILTRNKTTAGASGTRIGEKTPNVMSNEGDRPLSPLLPASGDEHVGGGAPLGSGAAPLRAARSQIQQHTLRPAGREPPLRRFEASMNYEDLLRDMPPALTPPPPELGYDRRFYGLRQGDEQYHCGEGHRTDPNFSSLGFLSPIYPNSAGGGSSCDERPRGSGTGCAMNGNMSSEEYSAMRSGGAGENIMPRRVGPRAGVGALPPPMVRPSSMLPPPHGRPSIGHGEGDLGAAEGYPFDDQSNLGFLVVTQLVKTGAADQAGLHVGDIFIKFGSITKSNFPGLKSLAEVVRQSVSSSGIPAVVLRRMEACVNDNGQPLVFDSPVLQKIHLTLRPLQSQDVGGGGVLGAVINTWPLPEPVKYH